MAKILAILFCTMALAPCSSCAQPADEVQIYYLLRHAEKAAPPADDPGNPHLSVKGLSRAAQLAKLLEHESLTAIYSSDYYRTRETIALLADQQQLAIRVYDPRDLPTLAEQLTRETGRILVVGHSNTTPDLVGLLGGDPGEPIDDATEFDRLYILQVVPGKAVSTIRLHYGG